MTETEQRSFQDKFMLRLPDGMRNRIRAAAESKGRSMNAEIIQTLENAYPSNPEIDGITAEIVGKVEAFKREKDPALRGALMDEVRDLNQVLQHELSKMIGTTSVSEDDDYIKHL